MQFKWKQFSVYYCEMADVVKSWFQTEAIQLTTMRFRYGVEVDIQWCERRAPDNVCFHEGIR